MVNMYLTEKVKKFGGIAKVNDAIQHHALDDVFCFDTGKWYTSRYWSEVIQDTYTGVSLRELYENNPLDATHFSGPLFNKMDEKGHVYEWVPQRKKWLYVGWHPRAELTPFN